MANKVEYGRRSSADPFWQECKRKVDQRDKCQDIFKMCLSAKEYHLCKPGNQMQIDHAHVFAASEEPEHIYNPKNVVCLVRWVHRRMDDYQNPLNGESVDRNEHFYWWYRIVTHSVISYNPEEDWEMKLRKIALT